MSRILLAAWSLTCAALCAQTVDGLVVNSVTGAPIPDVAVSLMQSGKSAYSAVTDTQGRFHIDAVHDGVYIPNYKARSFWPLPNLLDGASQPSFRVTAGGDPVHLEARMHPVPTITGRVVDAAGKPVPNAALSILWESRSCSAPLCFPFSHQSKAGEKGEFTITGFDLPGTWLLSAAAPASWQPPETRDGERLAWVQTFYPGVADSQLAARLNVHPGAEFSQLEIKLAARPVHRLRGIVLDAHGDPAPKAALTLGNDDGTSLRAESRDDGAFEFESVPDRQWRLSATVTIAGVKQWAAQPVRLEGRDLEEVKLRLSAPFAFHGSVVMAPMAGVAPRPPTVMLAFNTGAVQVAVMPGIFSGTPDANGDFTVRNLYPGPYQVLTPAPPAGYYLDSIRLGASDALANDVQILSDAQSLTVTFKPGGGTVRGTIEACAAGHVLLIPQDTALRRRLLRTTNCAPDGRFEITGVRPGAYYGLAIAGDSSIPWFDTIFDDARLNQTARVTVRAGETSSDEIRLLILR